MKGRKGNSDTDSQVRIDIKSPYFTIKSAANKTIMLVSDTEYYLQSDNYNNNTGSQAGMKINLQNGHIDAYDLKITSSIFTIDSINDIFKLNTKTITIDSTATGSNPYFRIGPNETTTLMNISSNSYYLQSANYSTANKTGMNINLSNGAITGYDLSLYMYSNGVEMMNIDKDNMVFRSPGWNVTGGTGSKIDARAGKILLRQNNKNDDKIVLLDVEKTDYPLRVGKLENGKRKFCVDWDGNLYATGANITGTITATSGSFTGTIYASGGTFGNITANGTIYMAGQALYFGNNSSLQVDAAGAIRATGTIIAGSGMSVFDYLNLQAGSNLSVGGTMSFGGSSVAKYDSGTATAGTYYMLNGSAINSLKASAGGSANVNSDTSVSWGMNLVAVDSNGNLYKVLTSANNIWDGINSIEEPSGYTDEIALKRNNDKTIILKFSNGLMYDVTYL